MMILRLKGVKQSCVLPPPHYACVQHRVCIRHLLIGMQGTERRFSLKKSLCITPACSTFSVMRFSDHAPGCSLEISVRGMYARMVITLCFGSRAQRFDFRVQHPFKVLAVYKMCMLACRVP